MLIAAELLKRANDLMKDQVHPTNVIAGFRAAYRESVKFIKEHYVLKIDTLGSDGLLQVAKTSLSSKLIKAESDLFANYVVQAMLNVKQTGKDGKVKYPIKAVKVLKSQGLSLRESLFLPGYTLQIGRACQGMPMKVLNAKIACLDFDI